MEKRNGRPPGTKDSAPRKSRNHVDGKIEREVVRLLECGATVTVAEKFFNLSKSGIRNILKRRGVERRFGTDLIDGTWQEIQPLKHSTNPIRGVYAIVFFPQDGSSNLTRIYFGSSTDIQERLYNHRHALSRLTHYNKTMNHLAAIGYSIKFYLLEESDNELEAERLWIIKYPKVNVLNTWNNVDAASMSQFLERATHSKFMLNYTINPTTGCWEVDKSAKSAHGYGRLRVTIKGITKYFTCHRVSYWKKHGTYPHLIRHTCNNRICMNPDHLLPGNYKDNAEDKKRAKRVD